ncbi:MAG: hypothetical protein WBN18_08890 [Flavobacteriaceae bacterium]
MDFPSGKSPNSALSVLFNAFLCLRNIQPLDPKDFRFIKLEPRFNDPVGFVASRFGYKMRLGIAEVECMFFVKVLFLVGIKGNNFAVGAPISLSVFMFYPGNPIFVIPVGMKEKRSI